MSINCSEIDNFNNLIEFFNSMKLISDELTKYLRTYKQYSLEFAKKLTIMQSTLSKKLIKSDNSSMNKIINLTRKLVELLDENLNLFKLSNDELELRIRTFEMDLKTKFDNIKLFQKKSYEVNKILTNSYIEINKVKKNYLDSISKTEEIINKYYSDKKIIDEHELGLGKKMNINDYNILKEKLKSELYDMNNSIKASKYLEKVYQDIIKDSVKVHDSFVENYKNFNTKIKSFNIDLSEQIKNLLLSFYLTYKNSYRQPMVSTDININSLNTTNESKETEKILTNLYKNDNLLPNVSPAKYYLKSFEILKEDKFFEKNEVNINSLEDDLKKEENTKNKSRYISTLEDGFSQMQYISDTTLFMTIKKIFENFKLIEKAELNLELEEIKFKTQQYILKLESNMNSYPFAKHGYQNSKVDENKVTVLYKRNDLTKEELSDLSNLLNNHESRIIFLQKLSDYRSRGKFYLDKRDYDLLLNYFNLIANKVKDNADYHCGEMIIILSQTYFLEIADNNQKKYEKKYIQEDLKKNELFRDDAFWEEFLCYAINKEIMKTQRRDKMYMENKTASDNKLSNVVFSQLLTLIDNMAEFGLDAETIKEIIEPKIIYYKLNDALKLTINDVLNSKIEGEKKKMQEKEKREKEKQEKEKQEKEKQDKEKQDKEKQEVINVEKKEEKNEEEIKENEIKEQNIKNQEDKKEEEIKKENENK